MHTVFTTHTGSLAIEELHEVISSEQILRFKDLEDNNAILNLLVDVINNNELTVYDSPVAFALHQPNSW
jgi:hypothetical protein